MRALTFIFSFFIALGCGGSGGTGTGGSGDGSGLQLTDAEITEYCVGICDANTVCVESSDETAGKKSDCVESCPAAMTKMNGALIPEFMPGLLSCATSTACDDLPEKSKDNSEKMDLVEYCMTNQPCAAEYDTSPTGGIMAKVLDVAKRCFPPKEVALIEDGMKKSSDPDDGMTAIIGCLSADITSAIDQCFAEAECEGLDFDQLMQACLKPIMDVFGSGEPETEESDKTPPDLPDPGTESGGDDAAEPADG